jgi:predicted Fe-Mo cluster-binding NifX family protein
MKIAASSSGNHLDSQIDPRFGRCAYFLIVDTDDMHFEAFNNESIALGGGAGIQAAQFVASKGAKAILTGNVGPNAVKTLGAAGVEVFVGQNGTVREAVERYKIGNLESTREATVADHHGMGGGSSAKDMGTGNSGVDNTENAASGSSGMGRGMGGGRCGGRGRGMGRGMQGRNPAPAVPASHMNEANQLREQLKQMKEQIKVLESKLGS